PVADVDHGQVAEVDPRLTVEGGEAPQTLAHRQWRHVGPGRRERRLRRRHTDDREHRVGMLSCEPDVGTRPVRIDDRHAGRRLEGWDPGPGSKGTTALARGPLIGDDHSDGPETRSPSEDRKSTRLNSSHVKISYAVFCL